METVVIGHQPQPDKLCGLLLLMTTNGILQQLTSVSHGLYVIPSVGVDGGRAKARITGGPGIDKDNTENNYDGGETIIASALVSMAAGTSTSA
jgi:hypothetical protein